jgi:cell division protein FtsB
MGSIILKIVRNKYLISLAVFIVWILFFDEYNLMSSKQTKAELESLLKQQAYYKGKIKSDQQKLDELNSGKDELEKYAREEFYMSMPGEDVYVVVRE